MDSFETINPTGFQMNLDENAEQIFKLSSLMRMILAELSLRTGMSGSAILTEWLEKVAEIDRDDHHHQAHVRH